MFKEAGLSDPPRSFDELILFSQAMAKGEKTGFITLNFDWLYWPLMRMNGVELLSPDLKKPAFNTPEAVAVLDRLAKATEAGAINKVAWTGRWVEPNGAFAGGNVGMFHAHSSAYFFVKGQGRWISPETLGAVQTICLDKTGTLTLNRMTVVSVYTGGWDITVSNATFVSAGERLEPLERAELVRLLQVAVLCSESEVVPQQGAYTLRGSPTENALVHMAMTAGLDVVQLRQGYPLLHTQQRAENHNVMRTWHTNHTHPRFLAVKGSPSEVLALCSWYMQDGRCVPLADAERLAIPRDIRSLDAAQDDGER